MSLLSNKKPLIIHVINDLSLGGAELLLSNTLQLLPDFRHIVVYLFDRADLAKNFTEHGIELICLHHKGWRNLFSSSKKLKAIINEKKPVLVHSHLFESTICARIAVPVPVPLISTIHSLYSKDAFRKNIMSLLAARLTLKKRHTLIAVSNCVLQDYLGYIPFKGKTFVLYNFLPDSSFQKRQNFSSPNDPSNNIKVVAVGNLKEAKNYPYLLDIFSHLKELKISLDIYGGGPMERELKEYIQRKNLNVRMCGNVNKVSDVLFQYDFFIQASSHEGFGLSVIEAMATGIPVILSDIAVFREITNGLAIFFPLNDANKAAGVIRNTFSSKDLSLTTQKGFDYVKAKYSSDIYRHELLKIYKEVVQKTSVRI